MSLLADSIMFGVCDIVQYTKEILSRPESSQKKG